MSKDKPVLKGKFIECDTKTHPGRFYNDKLFQANLKKYRDVVNKEFAKDVCNGLDKEIKRDKKCQ